MDKRIEELHKEYQEKLTNLVLEIIRNDNPKVFGRSNGFSFHTVDLLDRNTGDFIIRIWTENRDSELTHLYEYDYEPLFSEVNSRKEIFAYLEKNLNK